MSQHDEQDQLADSHPEAEYSTKNEPNATVPVTADEELDVGGDQIDPEADSDAQLQKDDDEAIDKSNIVDSKTRGAAPEKGAYREPGDDEGIEETA